MITQRLSRALIAFAADRWPEHLRTEVHREWLAELAVLTEQRRHGTMLRFALSLATHPAPRPAASAALILTRFWSGVRLLLVGPVLCQLLLLMSMFVMSTTLGIVTALLPAADSLAMNAQLPMMSLMCLASAYLASRTGQRWSPGAPGFLLPVLIATVPAFLMPAVLLNIVDAGGSKQPHISVFAIYFLGFGAVLYLAARLARGGRRKHAWWLGIAGAIVAGDIAIIPAGLAIELPPEEPAMAIGYAPMWLPALLTDWAFGLPHPAPHEIFAITDVLVGVPQMLMIVTGWALGMVLGRAQVEVAALRTAPEGLPRP